MIQRALVGLGAALLTSSVALAAPAVWRETFAGALDWGSPSKHAPPEIQRVYSRTSDAGVSLLRASHDARPRSGDKPPSAMHYGRKFNQPPLLRNACHLSFKWRVLQHPSVGGDPWLDVAASVYVITRVPGLFDRGRGVKLGWTAKPTRPGTFQRGILQIELRHDAAGTAFRTENVDLCALYRANFGKIDDESVKYIGVVTDADGTKSLARADYADFVLSP